MKGMIPTAVVLGLVLLLGGPVSRLPAQDFYFGKTDLTVLEVEKMYTRGLNYLVRSQSAEGGWSDSNYGGQPAVVGFAVMAMLAHGDDPNTGPYSQGIRRGLQFILKQQDRRTGYIGTSMYNHGFATLALAEAYGMVDDPALGPALDHAVRLILSAQQANPLGGWRYSPDSKDADTTVSGAQMVALLAARNAGFAVPEEAIQKGLKFFETCHTADGGYGYTPGSEANATRTAIGCVVLSLAKLKNTREHKAAFEYLSKTAPDNGHPQYFLYYAAQAYFHASPKAWQDWNKKNIKMLSGTQNGDGSWEGQFGTTFGTATSLLSLALNYRYLPIYER